MQAPAAAPANAADAAASLKQQQQQRQPPAPPAPSTGSLYSWLTWGSVSPAGAAPTNDPASSSLLDAAALSDGMAADPAAVATTPAESSRSWYRRTRSSLGALTSSLGSIDEGEAAALAAAQQPRPEHPALQLMRARALAGSRPGQRSDAFKLGLVVEGGGMRGCVSGGALQVRLVPAGGHLGGQPVFLRLGLACRSCLLQACCWLSSTCSHPIENAPPAGTH